MKALLFLGLYAALVLAACNPLTSSCDPDPALGSSIIDTFTSESDNYAKQQTGQLIYSSNGLQMEIAKRFDNPSIKSNFYLMFGKVEVVMQAAKGKGVVSSFYLQSNDLDEIDIELLGGDPYEFQSNFFSKGNVETYDRGEFHSTPDSALDKFHTYTIEFTKDFVTWSFDGDVVRTLLPDNGQGFPQTPMYIMAGAWVGGDPSNEPGTIEWAGGLTDYSEAPFNMYIKSIIAADYSTGTEYKYTDQSGDWTSIEAVGGKVNGREEQAQQDVVKLQAGELVASESATIPRSSSFSESPSSASESISLISTTSSTVPSSSATSEAASLSFVSKTQAESSLIASSAELSSMSPIASKSLDHSSSMSLSRISNSLKASSSSDWKSSLMKSTSSENDQSKYTTTPSGESKTSLSTISEEASSSLSGNIGYAANPSHFMAFAAFLACVLG